MRSGRQFADRKEIAVTQFCPVVTVLPFDEACDLNVLAVFK